MNDSQPLPILFRVDNQPPPAPQAMVSNDDVDLSYLDTLIEDVETRRYPGAYSAPGTPSPYEQSPLCGSIIESDMRSDRNALHNARNPHYAIKFERFEHRVIAFLKAEGFSNKEIAEKTGMSAVAISNIIRQPYIQQQILRIIHEQGGDAVQELLQGAAADAVTRLISEMDNEKARSSERTSAANAILDRLYGKPNQKLEHTHADLDSLSDKELEHIILTGTRVGDSGGTETATSSAGPNKSSGLGES